MKITNKYEYEVCKLHLIFFKVTIQQFKKWALWVYNYNFFPFLEKIKFYKAFLNQFEFLIYLIIIARFTILNWKKTKKEMSNLNNSIEKKEDSFRQVGNSEEVRKEDIEAVVSWFVLLLNLMEDPFLVSSI